MPVEEDADLLDLCKRLILIPYVLQETREDLQTTVEKNSYVYNHTEMLRKVAKAHCTYPADSSAMETRSRYQSPQPTLY